MTRRKIKLLDSDDLRKQLNFDYQAASQETCARFGRDLVEHLIELTGFKVGQEPDVEAGWAVSQACLASQARMHDVRQAGFTRPGQASRESSRTSPFTGHWPCGGDRPYEGTRPGRQ